RRLARRDHTQVCQTCATATEGTISDRQEAHLPFPFTLEAALGHGYATAITCGSVRRGRIYHVHHKPLYEAIGLPDDRHRKLQSLGRMVQRLMILDGVLGDRNCWWMGPACD